MLRAIIFTCKPYFPMPALQKLLYFFIAITLWCFLFLSYKTWNFSLYSEMKFLYALSVLPLGGILYDTIFEKKSWRDIVYSSHTISWIATFLGLSIFLLFLGFYQIWLYIFLAALLFVYVGWDARIFFAIALLLLLYVIYFLMIQNSLMAEKLSIYVYYFLVAWVVVTWVQSSRFYPYKST